MPLYDCECVVCRGRQRYFSRIDARHSTPPCATCGSATEMRIFTAPMGVVRGKFDAFRSTVDGSLITGDRALREHNARNGVVNLHEVYGADAASPDKVARKNTMKTDVDSLAREVYEATQQVAAGYKPTVEVCDDDW